MESSCCKKAYLVVIQNFLVCILCGLSRINMIHYEEKNFYENITFKEQKMTDEKAELTLLLKDYPSNLLNQTMEFYISINQIMSNKGQSQAKKPGPNVKNGIKAACFQFACRKYGIVVEVETILSLFNCDRKVLSSASCFLQDSMHDEFIKLKTFSTQNYINYYTTTLKLSKSVKSHLEEITDICKNHSSIREEPPKIQVCVALVLLDEKESINNNFKKVIKNVTKIRKFAAKVKSTKESTTSLNRELCYQK